MASGKVQNKAYGAVSQQTDLARWLTVSPRKRFTRNGRVEDKRHLDYPLPAYAWYVFGSNGSDRIIGDWLRLEPRTRLFAFVW